MRNHNTVRRLLAVTLIELLVVVLIIGILATIATGVYSGETRRAKIAATQALINNLELAIARYEVDTGSLPPSGSGTTLPPDDLSIPGASARHDGSGYLYVALTKSMSGNANAPASTSWDGPYISIQTNQLNYPTATGLTTPGEIDILDNWLSPIIYVRDSDYGYLDGEFHGGTTLFTVNSPQGAHPNLPAPNVFVSFGETYYNTKTYQLISFGPNGTTLDAPLAQWNYTGTEADDITNFGY